MKTRWVVIVALAVVLSGCSTKFVYNWLDWIIEWQVEDYVDLDRGQERQLQAMIDDLMEWHRYSELPRYHAQLQRLRTQLDHGFSAEDAQAHITELEQHWFHIFDHLLPKLVPLLQSFSDQQVTQMMTAIRKENQKDIDRYLKRDLDDRVVISNKRMAKSLKRWVGKLTPMQAQAVDDFNRQRHQSMDLWVSYREAWQKRFQQAMIDRADGPGLRRDLAVLLVNPDSVRPQEYKDQLSVNQHRFAESLVEINDSLTGKQRKRLNHQLGSLIDDLADLSKK
ncbi:hypothetical protein SAMN04488540_11186 [Ferrimonas sediminum]|uniref:Lipoprotein n=1 Tax=Ferrimonas sediminum TaxID=718193 RepID=A0A1G8VN16_9GAMM|nr:DUF6279 family lipoprotein [Ferrimonas sediminum]SDJ66795.1 hypothetical protein SAMN04488540_11186 [Ferrimonas sediminum]